MTTLALTEKIKNRDRVKYLRLWNLEKLQKLQKIK
jgi:hypothetical protein